MAKLTGARSASTNTKTNAQIRKDVKAATGSIRPMGKAGAIQRVVPKRLKSAGSKGGPE